MTHIKPTWSSTAFEKKINMNTTITKGQTHQTKTGSPFTIAFHNGTVRLKHAGRVEIKPKDTRLHGERVERLHPLTPDVARLVDDQLTDEVLRDVQSRNEGPDSWLRIIGMVDMALKLIDMGYPVALVTPDAGLNPRQRLRLDDMTLFLSQRAKEGA